MMKNPRASTVSQLIAVLVSVEREYGSAAIWNGTDEGDMMIRSGTNPAIKHALVRCGEAAGQTHRIGKSIAKHTKAQQRRARAKR